MQRRKCKRQYIYTYQGSRLVTGVLSCALLLQPAISAAQENDTCGSAGITAAKGHMLIIDQLNHPYVRFSVNGTNYIAVQEAIDIEINYVGIYKDTTKPGDGDQFLSGGGKNRLRLAEAEKTELVSNSCVKSAIIEGLQYLRTHPHLPISKPWHR